MTESARLMSEIKADLQRVLAEYVALSDNAFLTDWVIMAASISPTEADQNEYFLIDSGMPAHTRLGLIHLLRMSEEIPGLSTDDE